MARSTKHDSSSSPTQAVDGLNRSLVGFNEAMEAELGSSIPNSLDSLASGLGAGASVRTLSKINSSLSQVLDATSASETQISYTAPLRLKVGIPKGVKDAVSGISGTLEEIISALESLKFILEALKTLIISLEDALKILLEEILNRIVSVLNIFKLDAKARVLLVPPILPKQNNLGVEPNIIDKYIIEGFTSVVEKAYTGTGGEEIALPGFLTRANMRNRLLGYSTQARNLEGSAAFLDTISRSFEDERDFNRPTEELGWTGGILVQAGFPSLTTLLDTWESIQRLLSSGYNNFFSAEPSISPTKPEISRVKVVGYDEEAGSAELFVLLNDPSRVANTSSLYPSEYKFAVTSTEVYILRSPSGVSDPNTRAEIFQAYDAFSENNVEQFTPVYINNLPNFLPQSSVSLANQTSYFTATEDSEGTPLTPGSTYELRMRAYYSAYKLSPDGIYELTADKEPFSRYSSPVTIRIPVDSNRSARPLISDGPQPNWIQYGKNWTIPLLDDLKVYFNLLIEQLRSFLSVAGNAIQQIIDLYITLINKLKGMLQTLLNISYLIDKLLNLQLGADIVMFTCNNGAAGLRKAAEDYLNSQKEGYEAALATGSSTTGYSWYANGESVCGAMLTATSETAEIIERFFSVMGLLFSSDNEENPTAELAVSTDLSKVADIAAGHLGNTNSNSLFGESLQGLNQGQHAQSPENTCG